jgi:hypothetical protein
MTNLPAPDAAARITDFLALAGGRRTDRRKTTKTVHFLDLATERHGPLASIPLDRIAWISADLAPTAT